MVHSRQGMETRRSSADRLDAVEGADPAALGIDAAPESAPPGAEVDDEEHLVPGAGFDDARRDQSKPWFTSLAAESGQAGVANEVADAEEPHVPTEAEDPR